MVRRAVVLAFMALSMASVVIAGLPGIDDFVLTLAPEPDDCPVGRFAGARCAETGMIARPAVARPSRASSPPEPIPARDPMRPARLLDIEAPSPSLPNPFVRVVDGEYLMVTTEARDAVGAKQNVPVLRSADLRSWEFVHDALPDGDVGEWAVPEATWAPDIVEVDGGWALYYTARHGGLARATQCIGVATADEAEGPYTPAPEPIVCQVHRGGSIDPRTFRDHRGVLWLHWKSDDNSDVEGTSTSSIHAQRLAPDGTRLVSWPTRILEVTQPWEGRIVEAPQMVAADGRLWLFYSANWFNQPAYAIGVAVCDTPAGPCHKPYDRPWLASNAQGDGPGEGSLFQDLDGRWRMVYAPVAQQFRDETDRPIALATIGFDDAGPYLAEPADDPPARRPA